MTFDHSLQFAKARLATGAFLNYAIRGNADGEPIVFLHGWPDSWFSFSRVLPLLSPRLRALVLDQRGFGDSERPDRGYRIDDFATDVVAFLDAVSLQRATVVGHSFGSFVARHGVSMTPSFQERIRIVSLPRSKMPSSGSIKQPDIARTGNARKRLRPTFSRFCSRREVA